jgi:hypothetical protein
MRKQPNSVYVIVDRNFGDRLASLPIGVPVWIVGTPANTDVAHRLWKERPSEDHLTGITTFNISWDGSPEENLIDELDMIDLHHGIYSADPPYMRIEVIGTPVSEKIKLAFADYGFDEFSATSSGFLATRKSPTSEASN